MIRTSGVRIGWADLPARIREVETVVGGPVVRAVSQNGPAWLDTLLLAMNVLVHGGPGDRLLTGIDPDAATGLIAGFTSDFLDRSRHPSPGIPHVRAFQRAQADAVLPRLRARLAG